MSARAVAVSTIDHPIGAAGRFSLQMRSGDVHIRGVDGHTVRIAGRGGDDLDGFVVERGDGALSVGTQGDWIGGRAAQRAGSIDLVIEVPVGASIAIESASGDIRATGLVGEQRYRTASGDVELQAVRGMLGIDTVLGDIDLIADGQATITARSVSGDIDLRAGTIAGLRVGTTSGDVRVAARFGTDGPFAIETVGGDVTLAAANDVRIEAITITGDVRSDRTARLEESPGRRTLVIGDGGPTITFRSTSGDLRVVRAAALTPGIPVPAAAITTAEAPERAPTTSGDDPRLEVLRALERGDIDVDEAERRLLALDDLPDANGRHAEAGHAG